ncbi:hypothetical protein DTO013E5_9415 [Penicillium roqueforti]|nr:hypothetical protein DTO012A1_9771 [Penicillium roqueforti]KAI2739646.1 hypothetical protein DTO013F2_9320 [Penicillium roqueforti]KAI2766729.1 hypothetical protein DTO012A8_8065 [Penicillium roqueforti]KAI3067062.1 hypothetical protein CBS147339_8607 [Penicillium roqueforti]KAI3091911.1 hypothetical protein CBS147338_8073 [Penicillium roqueforti]
MWLELPGNNNRFLRFYGKNPNVVARDAKALGKLVKLGEDHRDIEAPSELVEFMSQEGHGVVIGDSEGVARFGNEGIVMYEVFRVVRIRGDYPVKGRSRVSFGQPGTLAVPRSSVVVVVDEG